ncbi:MAG: aconitase X swivel domain-containing protein [Actinomycetota bacterium]
MSEGSALLPGRAVGRALVLSEPLSFWGGVDPADGTIIDRHHPQAGETVRGRVLVMPSGRGSSSSSSVLAETIRAGTGPVAIVLAEPDGILALGALVASKLYARTTPVVAVDEATYRSIASGAEIEIRPRNGVWEVVVRQP